MYFLAGSKTIAKLNNLFKYPGYLGLKRINVKMFKKGWKKPMDIQHKNRSSSKSILEKHVFIKDGIIEPQT